MGLTIGKVLLLLQAKLGQVKQRCVGNLPKNIIANGFRNMLENIWQINQNTVCLISTLWLKSNSIDGNLRKIKTL